MAFKNSPFFDSFPKIEYDINNITPLISGPHETVTDIFFRFGVVKNILNNLSAYYVYEILDSDTPEILAEKIYGDAGAGWLIIYANKIFDPLFDWPLQYESFQKMIIDKYGSVQLAQTTTHHYEKVVTRVNSFYGTTSVTRFIVDGERQSVWPEYAPYEYYFPFTKFIEKTADSGVYRVDTTTITADNSTRIAENFVDTSLATSTEFNTYSVDGKTVTETISGEAISNYDYELKKNDDKKLIKIIKSDYYQLIMNEFKTVTGTLPSYLRT